MKELLIRIAITAVLVMVLAFYLPGVSVAGITGALVLAVVLGLINIFVKPIIKLFTFPITILTLGLFLLVINALMVMLADYFVDGFAVTGFVSALIFAILLSIAQSIVFAFVKK